jgi:hypothetical protein
MRSDVARGGFLESERLRGVECGLPALGLARFDWINAFLAKPTAFARLDPRTCKGQRGQRAKAHFSRFAVQ